MNIDEINRAIAHCRAKVQELEQEEKQHMRNQQQRISMGAYSFDNDPVGQRIQRQKERYMDEWFGLVEKKKGLGYS